MEAFLFENVYRHPKLMDIRQRAATRLKQLFKLLVAYPIVSQPFSAAGCQNWCRISHGFYLGGMTDRFCDDTYVHLVELGREQGANGEALGCCQHRRLDIILSSYSSYLIDRTYRLIGPIHILSRFCFSSSQQRFVFFLLQVRIAIFAFYLLQVN